MYVLCILYIIFTPERNQTSALRKCLVLYKSFTDYYVIYLCTTFLGSESKRIEKFARAQGELIIDMVNICVA